jgi:hypothetical protein
MPREELGSLDDCYVIQENGKKALAITGGGQALDVALQDQTTDAIIVYFNQVHDSTALAVAVPDITTDPRIIVVDSATGIVVGSYIILFDPDSLRFSTFFATAVNGVNISLDSPIDFEYPIGTFVDVAIVDMSVDGSGTPQVFGLRGVGAPPGIELTLDVTRIIFICIADSSVSLSLFANITALTNGLLLRSRNGRVKNIFNVKDNREIQGIMFDYTPSTALNPAQGEDGFVGRLTFASPGKIGVAVRLPIGEDLETWIQDNLLGITSLRIYAEGHIVED